VRPVRLGSPCLSTTLQNIGEISLRHTTAATTQTATRVAHRRNDGRAITFATTLQASRRLLRACLAVLWASRACTVRALSLRHIARVRIAAAAGRIQSSSTLRSVTVALADHTDSPSR